MSQHNLIPLKNLKKAAEKYLGLRDGDLEAVRRPTIFKTSVKKTMRELDAVDQFTKVHSEIEEEEEEVHLLAEVELKKVLMVL